MKEEKSALQRARRAAGRGSKTWYKVHPTAASPEPVTVHRHTRTGVWVGSPPERVHREGITIGYYPTLEEAWGELVGAAEGVVRSWEEEAREVREKLVAARARVDSLKRRRDDSR